MQSSQANHSHYECSPGSFDECRLRRQDYGTDLSCAVRRLLAAIIHIQNRHLLLLLSPKSDTILPFHGGRKVESTQASQDRTQDGVDSVSPRSDLHGPIAACLVLCFLWRHLLTASVLGSVKVSRVSRVRDRVGASVVLLVQVNSLYDIRISYISCMFWRNGKCAIGKKACSGDRMSVLLAAVKRQSRPAEGPSVMAVNGVTCRFHGRCTGRRCLPSQYCTLVTWTMALTAA